MIDWKFMLMDDSFEHLLNIPTVVYISNSKNNLSNLGVFKTENFMLIEVLKLGKQKKKISVKDIST